MVRNPNDAYFSYQFAATYNINDKNIIRAVASRSNSGAFQAQNFLDIREDIFPGFSAGFIGNENLELFQVQLFELGYRSKFMDNLEFNAELFYQTTQNSNDIVQDVTPTTAFAQFTNLDIEATQVGATFSMNFIPTTQWQIKPFVTVQKTETEKLPTGLNTANADPVNNIENTIGADNEQTPSVFGGLYVNFSPTSKWNLNLNAYYIGEQTQYSFYDFSNPANTLGEIDGKVIMNAKVAYSISNKFNVFVNGRNILNSDSREFYGADRNGMQILGGFNFQL